MSEPEPIPIRMDDLRRHATELATQVGVAPARAAALAAHLLWFDAVGAARFGIASFPRWLERIRAHEIDAAAEGKVMTERAGTAVLDGRGGLPPLILLRAAAMAAEKAREGGVGLVRVTPLGPTGPGAAVAAELAIGPYLGLLIGPGPTWSFALPSDEGLPVVYDSALENKDEGAGGGGWDGGTNVPAWLGALAPWTGVLAPGGGWLVAAVAVAAWESLVLFHGHVHHALEAASASPGLLRPEACAAGRRALHEHGLTLPRAVWNDLKQWAEQLGVAPLGPDPR